MVNLFYMNLFIRASIAALLIFSSPEILAKKRYSVPPLNQVMSQYGQKSIKSLNQELDPSEINILVWNMYKGSIPEWRTDYVQLVKFFDILLLQEMWMDGAMKEVIGSDDTYTYHMATSFFDRKKKNTPTGVAIASYVEPEVLFFQRSKYREPFIKTPKMALFADFALKGMTKKLRVVTLHAINFVSKRKLKHQLDNIASALKKHKGPIVLGGDFNTWSKKKIKIMRKMAKKAGLTEVKFSKWGAKRLSIFGNIVDYIWVKDVNVLDSYIFHQIQSSDHKALSVKISID